MKVIKLLSLLLCLALTVPMLFACDKKEEEEQDSAAVDYVDKGLLPDYKCTLGISANTTYPEDPSGAKSFNMSQGISFNNGNFHLSLEENGIDASLTLYHNVLYLNAFGMKYKIDMNDIDIKTLLALALNSSSTREAGAAVMEEAAVIVATPLGDSSETAENTPKVDSSNPVFKSVTESKDENGNDVVTYKGVKSRSASIADRLIAYMTKRSENSGVLAIDYENLTITVTTNEELDVLGATLSVNIARKVDGKTVSVCDLSINSYYEYGSSTPVVAPVGPDTYKDAIPEIMKMLSDALS